MAHRYYCKETGITLITKTYHGGVYMEEDKTIFIHKSEVKYDYHLLELRWNQYYYGDETAPYRYYCELAS